MQRTSVTSSTIKSIGFADRCMHIEFNNGQVYEYTGPKIQEHYDGLMAAESKGKYFAKHIRRCPHTNCKKWEPPKEEPK